MPKGCTREKKKKKKKKAEQGVWYYLHIKFQLISA